MNNPATTSNRKGPGTPWGLLPSRLRLLYIGTARRTGSWLAEAFASDSACEVSLCDELGATAGLARLREESFDVVLVSHDPGALDALELLEGLRASGADTPLVVLGQASEQELAAPCFEVGADGYLCVNTATTRMLLWVVARAAERRKLIREHRLLSQAQQQRLQHERSETEHLLTEQRGLSRDWDADTGDGEADSLHSMHARLAAGSEAVVLPPSIVDHYRELLRAHVIMGSGNLAAEMAALAEALVESDISAPQIMQLHVQVLEELVRGLGSRSARHVMTRADLLVLEMLVHLAERYRLASART